MTGELRILLIDDNPSDRALVIRELRREFPQVQVKEIVTLPEFEQAIANNTFDAVITDYQLHWSDGLNLLRQIKSRSPSCPVIMFTNTGTEEVAVEALQAGLDDYILKSPNRYIRVPSSVRMALERTATKRRAVGLEIRLQSLLNQLKVGIFRATPEGSLIEGNQVLLDLLGVSSIVDAQQILQPHLCRGYQQLMAPSSASQAAQLETEMQWQRSDGAIEWASLTITVNTINGDSVIDGLLEVITDRKQAELAILQLNETLEERVRERTVELEAANQKLELANQDLEEFAYSISHDLRAPLRVIQGFCQILLEDHCAQLDATGQFYLQRINNSTHKAETLIQDLLSYSRLSRVGIPLETIHLTNVVAEVLSRLEPDLQTQQAQITVEEPLPLVIGNYPVLVQVLTNLLINAIKFVEPNVQPQVRLWAENRDRWTRLWVQDNGIGIAVQQHQRIFNPFERLHSSEVYPGSGIGLAIVRKGMQRMGGRVGVESETGQGSRFWIELPTARRTPS